MTGETINPNSRNFFVDSNGRLSKYGMDVILKLYRALQINSDGNLLTSLQDQLTNKIEYSDLSKINSKFKEIESIIDAIPEQKPNLTKDSDCDMITTISRLESKVKQLQKRIDDLEAQI
jgi:uncharacterized phage infection (PIP) family protein YhgE